MTGQIVSGLFISDYIIGMHNSGAKVSE